MDGGLTAASLVSSPPLYLRTAVFLSNQPGPPHSLAGKGGRAEFIRLAIGRAIREEQNTRVQDAYAAQPDSESEADDWSNWEEFKI
jgi:hypothetical protein